ncbi:MAG: acyl-CoA dehydrogenase family protein [Rhodospirillaceae bacterium]
MNPIEHTRTDFPAYLETVKDLTENVLRPNEHRLTHEGGVPEDLTQQLREYGLFAMTLPVEYGGLGLSSEQQARLQMAVTRASCVYRSRFSTTVGLVCQGILQHGTDEQRKAYLPRLATGELTGAFALTEVAAGSDAAGVATTAKLDGNAYVLNGTKRYITNANIADVFIVMARTDADDKSAAGMSAFIVEKGAPGMEIAPIDRKMGQDGAPTAAMTFDNCRVPVSALVGAKEGIGFKVAMAGINTARMHVACTAVGQAERLTEEALDYAVKREQFGQPIAEFQAVQNMLADCRAETLAAKCMILETARGIKGPPTKSQRADISCCKYFATEMVGRVADRAVQILGGAGYLTEHPVERLYRDVRLLRLFEGTSQIHQGIIARHMIEEEANR